MKIEEAIKNLEDKKLNVMKENINQVLSDKAIQKLDEMKRDLANQFFRK